MFDRLFGKDKQAKPNMSRGGGGGGGNSEAMEKINNSMDLLEKREAVLEKRIEQELTKAKQFQARKNTQGALQCMKRKKQYEEQLMAIGNQKLNLETLKASIENQSMNANVLEAQVAAKNNIKKANKKMDAGKIEDTMDELRDEMDKANQVSEALQAPLDSNFVDEDELLDELNGLMEEDELQNLEDLTEQLDMPNVPSQKLPAVKPKAKTKQEEDEEELAALEAQLAM